MRHIMKAATLQSIRPLLLLSFLLMTTWAGCTGNKGSGTGDAGAVTYRLAWTSESSMASNRSRAASVTGDVCEDYDIEWIHAQVLDQEGTPQASEKWLCSLRKGELTGIPEGTYSFRIEGEVAGEITWRGEATDLKVPKNGNTHAGTITMRHLKDHDAPVVTGTAPTHEAQNIPIDSTVTATFDEALVDKSIDPEIFILAYTDPSGVLEQVAAEIRYDEETHTAVLTPAAALLNDTTYTAVIMVDGNKGVQDIAGNQMQETFQWQFTTFKPDGEGPQVISRTPEKDTMDVATTAIVHVRFSEPVDPQTITEESVRLERNGTPIQCDIRYDGPLNTVTLTPAGGLPRGATLTVTVTTDVVDAKSNPMPAAESWAFVTQFPSWHTEQIEKDESHGTTRIALETNNDVHIAIRRYYDDRAAVLEKSSDNEWSNVTLFGTTGVGEPFDIAIDSIDMRMYIAVEKETNIFEGYAQGLVGGGIGVYRIEATNPLTNIKSVSFGKVYNKESSYLPVCYYDAYDAQLKVSANETSITVDTASGELCAIANSADDLSHLSYLDKESRQLRYAISTANDTWAKETLDEGTAVGAQTAITVDSAGRPHICYREESNSTLKYAYRQPTGDWLIETVDSNVAVGEALDIAVDSLGQAHISYRDTANESLKYAARTGIGRWHTNLVDTDGRNGYGSSITVDPQDYVHISYSADVALRPGYIVRYATTRPQN